jgi:hypothetical protein
MDGLIRFMRFLVVAWVYDRVFCYFFYCVLYLFCWFVGLLCVYHTMRIEVDLVD